MSSREGSFSIKGKIDVLETLQSWDLEPSAINGQGYVLVKKECPFCGKKKKLYVNVEPNLNKSDRERPYGFINCFKCNKKGEFLKLYSIMEDMPLEVLRRRFSPKKKKTKNSNPYIDEERLHQSFSFSQKLRGDEFDLFSHISNLPLVKLPKCCAPIEDCDPVALEYCQKRGLDKRGAKSLNLQCVNTPSKWKILDWYRDEGHWSESFKERVKSTLLLYFKSSDRKSFFLKYFQRSSLSKEEQSKMVELMSEVAQSFNLWGRVIFPAMINDKIIGYVARDYTGESSLKVINSSGNITSDALLNFDLVKRSKTIILNEGVFDSVSCGVERAIPLLGKNINPNSPKLQLLKELSPERFVIYLDPGAYSSVQQLAKFLSSYDHNVYVVMVPSLFFGGSLSESEVLEIASISGITVEFETERGVYLSYRDYRVLKNISRMLKKLLEKSRERACQEFFRLEESKDPYLRTRVTESLEKFNDQRIIQNLSLFLEGDFVDANYFTKDENEILISMAVQFTPYIDLESFNLKITKLPSELKV